MGTFGDIGGAIGGGLAGIFGNDGSGDAERYYKELAAKYGNLDPRLTTQQASASAEGRGGQLDVLRELQNTYRQGGLDPIAREQLAQSSTEAARNAQAIGNAIQQRSQAQGMGNSGVTAALQGQAAQGAMERGAEGARGAAAQGYANRMGALSGAAGVATGTRAQDDAISQFNARMRMGAQQGTFENSMAQLGGQGQAYGGAYGAQQKGYANSVDKWAGLGQGIGGLADFTQDAAKNAKKATGGGGDSGGGDLASYLALLGGP